jgi:hypothetical protein
MVTLREVSFMESTDDLMNRLVNSYYCHNNEFPKIELQIKMRVIVENWLNGEVRDE